MGRAPKAPDRRSRTNSTRGRLQSVGACWTGLPPDMRQTPTNAVTSGRTSIFSFGEASGRSTGDAHSRPGPSVLPTTRQLRTSSVNGASTRNWSVSRKSNEPWRLRAAEGHRSGKGVAGGPADNPEAQAVGPANHHLLPGRDGCRLHGGDHGSHARQHRHEDSSDQEDTGAPDSRGAVACVSFLNLRK